MVVETVMVKRGGDGDACGCVCDACGGGHGGDVCGGDGDDYLLFIRIH